jgi:DNA-binding transcriptional ArsR family regulator
MRAVAAKPAKNGNGTGEFERKNVSQLAFRFDLDRGTVRKRLMDAGIIPIDEKAKEKLYELTDRLIEVLERPDKLLDEAKLRKETAVARQQEIKASIAEGEVASVAEFTDAVQRLFASMHKELAVRMPKQLAARLAKAKTPAEASKILGLYVTKVFTDLRDDHQKFLKK